jgi:hypothetical protein
LVDRSVGGVKLPGEIIETHVATRSTDPSLGGGGYHRASIYHKNGPGKAAGR